MKWGDFDCFIGHVDPDYEEFLDEDYDPVRATCFRPRSEVESDHIGEVDKEDDGDHEVSPLEEQVVLSVQQGCITGSNDMLDYWFRSSEPAFDQLSLWEHTELVHKISQSSEDNRKVQHVHPQLKSCRKPGPALMPRGQFSTSDHPQYTSHVSRLRSV